MEGNCIQEKQHIYCELTNESHVKKSDVTFQCSNLFNDGRALTKQSNFQHAFFLLIDISVKCKMQTLWQ